jgi:hypothetical protein
MMVNARVKAGRLLIGCGFASRQLSRDRDAIYAPHGMSTGVAIEEKSQRYNGGH